MTGAPTDPVRPGGADDGVTPELLATVQRWIADDPDPATAAEAADLLARACGDDDPGAAADELADRFAGLLPFGTAGLRGRLGAGPSRMNRAVVIRTAAALSGFLAERLSLVGADRPRVVIGFDARHGSAAFAADTAAVVTAAGGDAILAPGPLPTPLLAFAVRHLDADAGVMVTASHNPAPDNGYKVYLGGRVETGSGQGAQLVPPADAQISARMSAIVSARAVPRAPAGWRDLDAGVRAAYVDRLLRGADAGPGAGAGPRIVLTPLHGVGGPLATEVLSRAGFTDVHVVGSQADPDPDFPTVDFPNPEEPGALDLALDLAAALDADLVLALDPDADRCAVAVPEADRWRVLTGDEVGALLGERAARAASTVPAGPGTSQTPDPASPTRGTATPVPGAAHRNPEPLPPVLASSVVSAGLLARIAQAHGLAHRTTLTGFKWIARVPGLVFGYEEALGYCVDPDAVRDKDGIAAALHVAALARDLAATGRSLADALDDLARLHGVDLTCLVAARADRLEALTATMDRLRAAPPHTLGGRPVAVVRDLADGSAPLPATDGSAPLPATDALVYTSAHGDRVVVRPSGTEPKLKCYLEVVEPVLGDDVAGARAVASRRLDALRTEVTELLSSRSGGAMKVGGGAADAAMMATAVSEEPR